MKRQLRLFPGTLNHEPTWELTTMGVQTAAEYLRGLLEEAVNEPQRFPITLFDIAKRKLGLDPDAADVPEDLAEDFVTIATQLHDERHRIKSRVEDISEFRLVIVDESGNSTLSGGIRHAAGFNLRSSDVGAVDDARQLHLTLGKLAATVGRHPEWLEGKSALEQLQFLFAPLRAKLLPATEQNTDDDKSVM